MNLHEYIDIYLQFYLVTFFKPGSRKMNFKFIFFIILKNENRQELKPKTIVILFVSFRPSLRPVISNDARQTIHLTSAQQRTNH